MIRYIRRLDPAIWFAALILLTAFDGGECNEDESSSGGGCSDSGSSAIPDDQVPQDFIEVYYDYWYHPTGYDGAGQSFGQPMTRLRAMFFNRVSDDRIVLSAGNVQFDGEPLSRFDYMQQLWLDGKVSTGDFVYTNAEGTVYRAALPPLREALIPDELPPVVPMDQPFEVTWDGPPLEEGERLEITMSKRERPAGDPGRQVDLTVDTPGTTSVVFSPEELEVVGVGTTVIIIRRVSYYWLEDSGPGGGQLGMTTFDESVLFELQ